MKRTNPVPPGYKRTKVGVIPEEWEVVKLKALLSKPIKNGYSPVCPEEETGYWVLGLGALSKESSLNLKEKKPAPFNDEKVKRFILKKNDFLISRANTPERVGYVGVYRFDYSNVSYPDLMMRFRINEDFVDIDYLEYFLKSFRVLRYLQSSAAGSSSSMVKINKNTVEQIPVALPPLKEQQKIAQILSTWDEAIAKLEALIEAKERFKKGLMQKLLSAELRFPGFEGEWEEVRLGEVATVIMGQSPSSKFYNVEGKGVPLIQGNADCENRKTSPRMYTTEPTKMCEKGDIIMTVRAPVGYVSKSHQNACIGRGVCAIRPHSKNDFLYYFLIMHEERWAKFSQGSTFTAVNSQDIKRLRVPYPSMEEQEKIVEVLSAIEREIKLYNNKLETLKEQKRGLVQKLLTWEVRVKK